MVEAELGIAIIPKSAASAYAGTSRFTRRPLAEAWGERELRLYAMRKNPRLPAVDAFINTLRG
jgi:DNA-binding transcriptional LysR family regulator